MGRNGRAGREWSRLTCFNNQSMLRCKTVIKCQDNRYDSQVLLFYSTLPYAKTDASQADRQMDEQKEGRTLGQMDGQSNKRHTHTGRSSPSSRSSWLKSSKQSNNDTSEAPRLCFNKTQSLSDSIHSLSGAFCSFQCFKRVW